MKTSIAVVVFLVLASQHSSMGLYIRKAEESTAKESAAKGSLKNRNDEWGLFKNTLGLTKEKGVCSRPVIDLWNLYMYLITNRY